MHMPSVWNCFHSFTSVQSNNNNRVMYRNVLVTGSNRGIGLEFVKQLLALEPAPKNVIGTTLGEAETLNELKASNPNLHILIYDAVDYDNLDKFVQSVMNIVADDGLDLLINNAGILIPMGLDDMEPKNLMKNINTNAIGPIVLTQKLLPALRKAAKERRTIVTQITSLMGSIDDNASGGNYAYRAGKTALNMLSKTLAVDVKLDNIIVLLLHPGWVQTEIGTMNAPITPKTSVTGMLKIIDQATIEKTALYANYEGKEYKW